MALKDGGMHPDSAIDVVASLVVTVVLCSFSLVLLVACRGVRQTKYSINHANGSGTSVGNAQAQCGKRSHCEPADLVGDRTRLETWTAT